MASGNVISKIFSIEIISFEWGKANTKVMTIGKVFWKLIVLSSALLSTIFLTLLILCILEGFIISSFEYTIYAFVICGAILFTLLIAFYFIWLATDESDGYTDIKVKYGILLTAPYFFVKWLIQPFKWLYDTIKLVFSFFYSIYKKCCPMIKWNY